MNDFLKIINMLYKSSVEVDGYTQKMIAKKDMHLGKK